MECHLRSVALFLVTLILFDFCAAQTRNDSIRLLEDVLRGYNRKHRPVLNYSQPVQLNATFYIVSLQELNEVNGFISVVLILSMTWYDEIMVWNPASYGGIESKLFDIEDVWYPRLVLSSSAKGYQEVAEDWMPLRIDFSGKTKFDPGVLVKSSCSIDVTYYPFDIQNCHLILGTWITSSNEVELRVPMRYTPRNYYTENGQWELVGSFVDVNLNLGMVHLQFKRKPLFAVINIIIPIIAMSILNLLVFVLPADSGERVSYTITVLLAIAVFLTVVADTLPKTSEPISLLGYFLVINFLNSCLICITTILNLRTFHNPDDLQIPAWQQRLARVVGCLSFSRRKHDCNNDKTVETQYSDKNTDIDTKEGKYEMRQQSMTDRHLSWRDVAKAVDRLLIIFFSLACILNIVLYFVFITTG